MKRRPNNSIYQLHQAVLELKPSVVEGELPEKSGHMLFAATYSGDQRSGQRGW